MGKFSLINVAQDFQMTFQEGDQIIFDMTPFCSGEYGAIVKSDKDFGLYIDEDDNYFEGCSDFTVIRNGQPI
jgi:hypothetical protein